MTSFIGKWRQNISVDYADTERFYKSAYMPQILLLLFRGLALAFMITVAVLSKPQLYYFKFFTTFACYGLIIYYALLVINTGLSLIGSKPILNGVVHHVYGILFASHLSITIIYWTFLKAEWKNDLMVLVDISSHALPLILLLFEFFLVSIPMPIGNAIFMMMYAILYLVYLALVVEYAFDGVYPYAKLNIRSKDFGWVATVGVLFFGVMYVVASYAHKLRDSFLGNEKIVEDRRKVYHDMRI